MRVCFVSFEYPPDTIGGAGTYAESLVKGLRSSGVDVFVITKGNLNDYHEKTFRVQTSNVVYWRRLFFIQSAIRLLRRLNELWKFDIVHFNEPHILLEKLRLPTICTFHSTQTNELRLRFSNLQSLKDVKETRDLILKSPMGALCDLFTVHRTDTIICPSSHLANLLVSYCFVKEEKIHVVPNGVDTEALDAISSESSDILNKYNLEIDNYLLFVGRLAFNKGIQYLLESFRNIKKEYSKLKLVIAGTGNYEGYLKKMANGIEDVVFTGQIHSWSDKKKLYKSALSVVVPSLYETFPMVILEAMAFEKPLIASDVGGIPMLVKHGKNGFLSKPKDPKSIEKFIKILYEDVNLRKNMGSTGRELLEKEFTTDKMIDNTLKVYKSVC